MSCRTYMTALGTGVLSATAGCTETGRAEVRMDSGSSTLHPATELYIANGLQPKGDDHIFATATGDASPEMVGPAAEGTIADKLRNPDSNQFHVIVQLRSTPDGPMELWPVGGSAFDWTDQSTLRAIVEVEPWGSFDRIDDEAERERLLTADELIFTTGWSLSPALDEPPHDVQLLLSSRG